MNSGKMMIKLLGIIVFAGGVNFSANAMNEDQSLYPKKRTVQPYKSSRNERIAANKEKKELEEKKLKEASDKRHSELDLYFTEEIDSLPLHVEKGSEKRFKYRQLSDDSRREERYEKARHARLKKEYNKMGLEMPVQEDDIFGPDLEDMEKQLVAEKKRRRLRRERAEREQRRLQREREEERRQQNLRKHTATPMVDKSKKRGAPINYTLKLNQLFNKNDLAGVRKMLQNRKVRSAVQGFDGYHVTRPETEMLNENMEVAKKMIKDMRY